MKTTWPRADIALKVNHDGQEMTHSCAAVQQYERIHKFDLRHMKGHETSITFITKHGTMLA